MVNQHGPLIQSAHEAAKIHTQRSKGNAATAMQYRPKEGELPVIAPELTSELLHCLSTLPDPWPLAKITIDMEKPSQWVSKMCRLFLADEYVRRTFFFSSMADVALWLGPYMSISRKTSICTRTKRVRKCRQITTNQTTQRPARRPANPPARLAFRQEKQQTRHTKGAGAQTKTPTKKICRRTVVGPLHHSQKHAKMN